MSLDKLINLPKNNDTICVDGVCGEAALNKTGLSQQQDSINSMTTA